MYVYIYIFMIIESKLCIYTILYMCKYFTAHTFITFIPHNYVYTMPNYVPLHTCTKRHTFPTFDGSMYSTYHRICQFDSLSGVTSFQTKI